jgi:hypothetical protein
VAAGRLRHVASLVWAPSKSTVEATAIATTITRRYEVTALAIINGAAIVVLVLVTTYYAWQTRQMVGEMRSARLLSLLPKLALDIEMIGPTFGDVVVRNVGPGAAVEADLVLTFEAASPGDKEERRWLAHVITPGEKHEFLPGDGIRSMDALVAKHPTIALSGTVRDARGQTHNVDERIDVAEAWRRLEAALHRWEESSDRKIVRELEKIHRELARIQRPVARAVAGKIRHVVES